MGNTKSSQRRSRSPHTAPGSGGSNNTGSSSNDRHGRPPRGSPAQPSEGGAQQHTPRGHPPGPQQHQQHPAQHHHPAQHQHAPPQGAPQAGSGASRGSNNRSGQHPPNAQHQPNQAPPNHQQRPAGGSGNPPRGSPPHPPPPGGYPGGPYPYPPQHYPPGGPPPPQGPPRHPHNPHAGRRPPGGRGHGNIMYVMPPQAAQLPEHSESETVKNHANLLKSTLGIESIGEGLYTLNFTVDTTAPTEVTIYFAAVEKADPDTPNSGGAMFTPQNAQLPNHIVKAGSIPVESGHRFSSPSDQPFDVRRYSKYLTYNAKQKPANYPIVIVLQYEIPARGASDEAKEGNQIGKQITYAEIETVTNSEGISHKIKSVRQRLQLGGNLYEVEDIYGAEAHTVMEGTVVEGYAEEVDVEGDECVICMSEEKDTVVMPCRHLCLCASCAEALRRQSNKCPICRTVIERLMTKRRETESI